MITPRRVAQLEAQYREARAAVHTERAAVKEARATVTAIEEAQQITQSIAAELQQQAHRRIATVVSRCLAAVFVEPYEFVIRFERKRNKTEAVLEFQRGDQPYTDPLNEVGGGVLDVAGLALRLACVLVSRPPARRVFILDEPWANVRGEGNRERTRRLLDLLAEEFGVQWIINTDVPTYRLGKVVVMHDGHGESVS